MNNKNEFSNLYIPILNWYIIGFNKNFEIEKSYEYINTFKEIINQTLNNENKIIILWSHFFSTKNDKFFTNIVNKDILILRNNLLENLLKEIENEYFIDGEYIQDKNRKKAIFNCMKLGDDSKYITPPSNYVRFIIVNTRNKKYWSFNLLKFIMKNKYIKFILSKIIGGTILYIIDKSLNVGRYKYSLIIGILMTSSILFYTRYIDFNLHILIEFIILFIGMVICLSSIYSLIVSYKIRKKIELNKKKLKELKEIKEKNKIEMLIKRLEKINKPKSIINEIKKYMKKQLVYKLPKKNL